MSEGTTGGGFVPGRLIVTLSDEALERVRQRLTPTRRRDKPTQLKKFGLDALDKILERFKVRSVRSVMR